MELAQTKAAADPLVQMRQDLQRALAKPVEQRSWAMVIDIRRCVGCRACEAACILENVLPPGVAYRTVPSVEWTHPRLGEVRPVFMPANCMQCARPPCVAAANAVVPGSFKQRPDGIVTIDYEKAYAQGREVFEAAARACPYRQALYYDDGRSWTDKPDWTRPTYEYNRKWTREEVSGSPRKCHFCLHRLEAGILPACVTTCIGRAIYFGDLNDPESFVSQTLREEHAQVLRIREYRGTEPQVYYLSDTPKECQRWH
ncbi:MAG: 4Fe-4S dicluster domain-containing protein [Candidatus Bipolaricaulia bacterium]